MGSSLGPADVSVDVVNVWHIAIKRLGVQELASSPDVVLISVSGQGPDDLTSTTSGGLRLLRLSHGIDLHIEDYNIRVRVHSLRSCCSYHTSMTSTNTTITAQSVS